MNLGNQQCPWLFITSGAMSAELGDMCSFLLCLLEGNVMLLSEPFFFFKGYRCSTRMLGCGRFSDILECRLAQNTIAYEKNAFLESSL